MDSTDPTAWLELSLEVTERIQPESREAINHGLAEFNTLHLGEHRWIALDVYVRDSEGQVIAGLVGGSLFDRLYIHALWVTQDRRGLGLGTRILTAAEQAATARRCRTVFLDTMTFQAPAFYKKRGYKEIATLDFQPGVQTIYLLKHLTPPL